jgi:hypothetical protein
LLKKKKITLSSESPFTIDFVFKLNTNFRTIVTDQLDERSKKAILTQQDPATMRDSDVVTLRNTISRCVYGNTLDRTFAFALLKTATARNQLYIFFNG